MLTENSPIFHRASHDQLFAQSKWRSAEHANRSQLISSDAFYIYKYMYMYEQSLYMYIKRVEIARPASHFCSSYYCIVNSMVATGGRAAL